MCLLCCYLNAKHHVDTVLRPNSLKKNNPISNSTRFASPCCPQQEVLFFFFLLFVCFCFWWGGGLFLTLATSLLLVSVWASVWYSSLVPATMWKTPFERMPGRNNWREISPAERRACFIPLHIHTHTPSYTHTHLLWFVPQVKCLQSVQSFVRIRHPQMEPLRDISLSHKTRIPEATCVYILLHYLWPGIDDTRARIMVTLLVRHTGRNLDGFTSILRDGSLCVVGCWAGCDWEKLGLSQPGCRLRCGGNKVAGAGGGK